MRETSNSSEGRKMNLNENIQNLRNVLDICKSCIISSPLLTLKDEGRINGKGSLSGKLMALALGNKYKDLFSSGEINPNNEKEFNERYMKVQNFLIELGKIFDEMVVPGSKGKNPIVDGFVKEMFRLNDSFYGLNRDIKEQTPSGIPLNDGSYDDHDYIARFRFAEMYETIIRDFDALKESNKRLGIVVYYSLLRLINKELEMLLGKVLEKEGPLSKNEIEGVVGGKDGNVVEGKDGNVVKGKDEGEDIENIILELKGLYREVLKKGGVLSKEDIDGLSKKFSDSLVNKSEKGFENVSKNLFIMDALGVKSYKDFCDKYDILKNKQKELFIMEELMKQFFDEKGSLELNAEIEKLHMKKIERSLGVNFGDVFKQKLNHVKHRIVDALSGQKMDQVKQKIVSFKQKIIDAFKELNK